MNADASPAVGNGPPFRMAVFMLAVFTLAWTYVLAADVAVGAAHTPSAHAGRVSSDGQAFVEEQAHEVAGLQWTLPKSIPSFDHRKLRTVAHGKLGSLDYRLHLHYDGSGGASKQISFWHDVPLHAEPSSDTKDPIFHFVCEIPKWTYEKMEVVKEEALNPIFQDRKNGKPRRYLLGSSLFNYGALPQTYEDPRVVSPDTQFKGDGDPIDVLELGVRQCRRGEIMKVRVLGVLALIDQDETDWKVLTINVHDKLAPYLQSDKDLEVHLPGAVHALREFLRDYKIPEGKAQNKFGFGGRLMPKEFALKVVNETHVLWRRAIEQYGGKAIQ